MKNKIAVGIVLAILLVVVAFSGCIEEETPAKVPETATQSPETKVITNPVVQRAEPATQPLETKVITDPVVQRAEPCISKIVFDDINLRAQAASIASGCPSGDKECQINKLYRYVVENYDYYSDPRSSEFIQSPSETMKIKGGDCEDLTILLSSLLENLGIKTYIVLTEDHVYCLACDVNIDHLQEEIFFSLNKEETWGDETISVGPLAARYYGGDGEQLEYSFEIKYSIDSSDPVDIVVVPSSESLALWSQGESYTYYPACSKEGVYRTSGSCLMDRIGGIMIINYNEHRVAVDIKLDVVYLALDVDTFSIFYYSTNGAKCVILEPALGEYGYPGYDTNIVGEKVAIDPISKEYHYLK